MPKSYYLPSDDAGRLGWIVNYAAKLPSYFTVLGLSQADVDSATADAAFWAYCLKSQQQEAAYAQQWTTYKNAARDGGAVSLGLAPVAPNLGTAPAAVAPGIFPRAKAMVARIRVAPGYTDAIGQALQIIGTDNPVDPTTLKPVLYVNLTAGQVVVGWYKQGMDALEIWVDRGDGKGFVFLAIDSIPDYTDTQALPATAAVWKYKAIYLQADQRVGSWSDVVSLPVAA